MRKLIFIAAIAALAPGARATVQADNDGVIEREVRREIFALPEFDVFNYVSLNVQDGIVSLRGDVTKASLKERAEAAVWKVDGVKSVVNRIDVLPVLASDDKLRIALYRAIYGFGSLTRYEAADIRPIRIIVRDGGVTLEGVVEHDADRQLAGARVRSLHVFSLTNNLAVDNNVLTVSY
jgi:osmotically-inducible protein OsmY